MRRIIEITNLTKDFGNSRGIFDLSFSLKQGEIVGFLGSNGAGKTTTIRHLMGFLKPQRGSAKILGMDCFADVILSILVDTFLSRISLTMLPAPNLHNTSCVLS